jgi:hypothetical protein
LQCGPAHQQREREITKKKEVEEKILPVVEEKRTTTINDVEILVTHLHPSIGARR